MGAGKTTVGTDVAQRIGRPFVDVDETIAEAHGPIHDLFDRKGETAFREIEARFVREALAHSEPAVIALGGGAVETPGLLPHGHATVVHLLVDVETAWVRARRSHRPLARDEAEFRRRFELRAPLYAAAADATARDTDDVVLVAAGVHVERGSLQRLGELVPGGGMVALVSDANVAGRPSRRSSADRERPSGSGMKTESSDGSATSASNATYVHFAPSTALAIASGLPSFSKRDASTFSPGTLFWASARLLQ